MLVILMCVTMGLSISYVNCGLFNILPGKHMAFLVTLQLFAGSVIAYFMDEILNHYGNLSSTVTLFIGVNSCRMILWQALSLVTYKFNAERGSEFEGSILNFVHLMVIWPNKIRTIYESFFWQNQPNLATLISTVFVLCLIVYLQGIHLVSMI
jgi:protein transport protein SEC61 subunit alpha